MISPSTLQIETIRYDPSKLLPQIQINFPKHFILAPHIYEQDSFLWLKIIFSCSDSKAIFISKELFPLFLFSLWWLFPHSIHKFSSQFPERGKHAFLCAFPAKLFDNNLVFTYSPSFHYIPHTLRIYSLLSPIAS